MITTKQEVAKMLHDPGNVRVMRTLFAAIAYYETVKGIIEPKQREILARHQWKPAADFQERRGGNDDPILDPKRSYLLADSDFEVYDRELKAFYPTVGFPDMGEKCPLLVAEGQVREVKMQVADYLEPYFGFGYDRISIKKQETYNQYYDLLLQMFADKVKELESREAFVKASQ